MLGNNRKSLFLYPYKQDPSVIVVADDFDQTINDNRQHTLGPRRSKSKSAKTPR
jgi:hypothetical protein